MKSAIKAPNPTRRPSSPFYTAGQETGADEQDPNSKVFFARPSALRVELNKIITLCSSESYMPIVLPRADSPRPEDDPNFVKILNSTETRLSTSTPQPQENNFLPILADDNSSGMSGFGLTTPRTPMHWRKSPTTVSYEPLVRTFSPGFDASGKGQKIVVEGKKEEIQYGDYKQTLLVKQQEAQQVITDLAYNPDPSLRTTVFTESARKNVLIALGYIEKRIATDGDKYLTSEDLEKDLKSLNTVLEMCVSVADDVVAASRKIVHELSLYNPVYADTFIANRKIAAKQAEEQAKLKEQQRIDAEKAAALKLRQETNNTTKASNSSCRLM